MEESIYKEWYERVKQRRRERYHNDPEYRERIKKYNTEYYHRVVKGKITAKKAITPIEPIVQFTKDGRRVYHDFEVDETEALLLDQRREKMKERLLINNRKIKNKKKK